MIRFNRYLKEIGIKKDSFPFKIEDDRYIEDKDTKISSAETWDLQYTLNLVIYSYLRAFKEHGYSYAHPHSVTHKKWGEILDEMIEGFGLAIKDDFPSNRKRKKIKKARRLLLKWYDDLWW